MNIKDYEGLKVKIISGDRDRVGDECTILNVQDNGDCEVHSRCDYHYSNIESILLNPEDNWSGYDMIFIKN